MSLSSLSAADVVRSLFEKRSRAIVAALLLLVTALVLPPVKLTRDTWTYIVVFDITQSMDVQDYERDGAPVSRLAYARNALRSALRDLPCGSRVGLGAFAEYRTLVLIAPIEVCANYGDLIRSLDNIDGRMRWGNSSEISKGVFWAVRAANEVGQRPNVIFLTDGQEAPPLGAGVQPLFEDIKPGKIHGKLIGVGGDTPRPIPRTDKNGQPRGFWRAEDVVQHASGANNGTPGAGREHLSSLREPHLQALARQVGFEYVRLVNPTSVSEAMRDPGFAERRPVVTDLAWLPALAALLVLALCFRPKLARSAWPRRELMTAPSRAAELNS